MSFVWTVVKFHLFIILAAVLIYYAPFATDVKFSEYKIPSYPLYPEGEKVLNNPEILFYGKIRGPEGFAVFKNELYISAHGGFIYKLVNDMIVEVIKTGKVCDGKFWEESKCGRPLGISFDSLGHLYIADAYYGILMANMTSGVYDGTLHQVVNLDEPIDGKKPFLPNSLDVSKPRLMYWTDSSNKHRLYDGAMTLFADGDGRLFELNLKSGKSAVLMDNLVFANGVALSNDKSFLIVAETARSRVYKYHLEGQKSGTFEVFLDNLPGYPDNIRVNSDGYFVISLINPFKAGTNLLEKLGPYPFIRKIIYKTFKLLDIIFHYLHHAYPHYIFAYAENWVGHFESFSLFSGKGIKILIVDDTGEVRKILDGDDGKVSHICDMIDFNGHYYLGSPYNNYLARVKKIKN